MLRSRYDFAVWRRGRPAVLPMYTRLWLVYSVELFMFNASVTGALTATDAIGGRASSLTVGEGLGRNLSFKLHGEPAAWVRRHLAWFRHSLTSRRPGFGKKLQELGGHCYCRGHCCRLRLCRQPYHESYYLWR